MLDCAMAFDEGIYLGALQTIDAITHPIETIKNSLIGIGVIAYGLSKLVSVPVECAFLYATDRDCLYLQADIITSQLETIIDHAVCYLQKTPVKEIIKQGMAIVTEGVLLTRIFTFTYSMSKRLRPIAHNYVEYVVKKEPMMCVGNGEIIPVQLRAIDLLGQSKQILANISINSMTQSIEPLLIALAKISKNKIHHILTPKTSKHAWHLVVKNPLDWNQVSNIIKQVLQHGKISSYGPVFKKELCCMNHIVEVVIAPLSDGSFSIADAWVKTR